MKKMLKGSGLAVVFIATVIVAGCGGSSSPTVSPQVQNISGEQLQAMTADADPVVIIDVRGPAAFAASHIPGSVNIPLSSPPEAFLAAAAELDPATRTVCVCAAGVTSQQAASLLLANGFTRVFNLQGGIGSWPGELESDG